MSRSELPGKSHRCRCSEKGSAPRSGEGTGGFSRRNFIKSMGAGAMAVAMTSAAAQQAQAQDKDEDPPADVQGMLPVSITINGRPYRLLVEPRWTLLYVMREELGITGPKEGCGRGECGACTVLIDDIPRYACLTLAVEASGKRVESTEGLLGPDEELGPVQEAFLEEDAYQCGYCTPGQVVAAEGLLRKNPQPSLDEIRIGMSGNICRCGTYNNIFKAVDNAAKKKGQPPGRPFMSAKKSALYYEAEGPYPQVPASGKEPAPWDQPNVVGTRKSRVDGYERISGAAVYPSDVTLPDMLYAAPITSPYPNAVLKSLDTSEAEDLDGVHVILTPDSPEADLKWSFEDMKVSLLDRNARYEGWIVGTVAADTPYKAHDAIRAMKPSWDVLPFVSDEREALKSRASKVHPDGNIVKEEDYSRGDVSAGFTESDSVLEFDFRTEAELQTPVELHGCVARWDGDNLTLWESTQGVFEVQSTVAEVLGMPLSRVRVIGHYVGGGFGSKLRTSKYAILAALLAKHANRPVKFFHTREHTFLDMGNRPATTMHLKAGVKKDGTLTAMDFSGIGASGAYPASGTSLVDWQIKDLYTCPNVKTKLTDVYINAGPARPFRAPGYPQGNWAMEIMMDALAHEIDMDPVELRLKNIPLYSPGRKGNPEYTTTGLKECITRGAEVFGWQDVKKRTADQDKNAIMRRGVGMAACNWFIGGGRQPVTVIVKLFADGSVNLNMGASDIGTGTKTIMALVVSEELGVDYDSIQIENADTGTTQFTQPSGGSKTVPSEAPAVRMACVKLKEQLMEMAGEDLEDSPQNLVFAGKTIHVKGDPSKSVEVTSLSRLSSQKVAMGIGHKKPNPKNKVVVPFGAQYCEVEVNTLTGEVRLLRFVAAHESGRVMDRLTFDCQVIGGIAMGIGLGTTEMRVLDHNKTGKLCNKNWHDYKLPTALDVAPDTVSEAIEMPDYEANISGAKGLGEPVTVPTASAIANAVYDAVGVRMLDTPINPTTLAAKIAEKAQTQGAIPCSHPSNTRNPNPQTVSQTPSRPKGPLSTAGVPTF
eukprot:TRINITY_DN1687_c0_g1_i1.p2 TRINITY_DN1687_c0_g1~~TRINITY_DN1687_c0_g1_i1.p2  ORF type:complete len:1047 (-),score=224.98 TRINITY_DN1687_c0_g1_i1:10828-13968(-)